MAFTIEVFVRSDAKGVHVDVRGLEAGQILSVHLRTPESVGLCSFIGTVGGAAKPVLVRENSLEEEREENEKEEEKRG